MTNASVEADGKGTLGGDNGWALLELVAPGRLEEDLIGLEPALQARRLHPELALLRQLQRGNLPVARAKLVAGRLPFVRLALQRLGIPRPAPLDYLNASEAALGRGVWASTLGSVAAHLEHRGEPVFIKPRGAAKRFTGRVVAEPSDLWSIPVTSPSTPVWCSHVIDIVSEHRVFIRHGHVVAVQPYDGDLSATPPRQAILAILAEVAGSLPAGCALDLAVTRTGGTLLVEANDGYSLGRYGLNGGDYLDLLLARWTELVDGQPHR